jgi:hypothetical protein
MCVTSLEIANKTTRRRLGNNKEAGPELRSAPELLQQPQQPQRFQDDFDLNFIPTCRPSATPFSSRKTSTRDADQGFDFRRICRDASSIFNNLSRLRDNLL